jgi:DNA-binding response OmpR family regulator
MGRILLLEPDAILGRSYVRALEKAGHEVNWCQTAQTAIHTADQTALDLIILELQLAAHSGVEFLYELRSYPEWGSLPIIINSHVPPNNVGLDQQQLTNLGIVAYLYKPQTNLRNLQLMVNNGLTPAQSLRSNQ